MASQRKRRGAEAVDHAHRRQRLEAALPPDALAIHERAVAAQAAERRAERLAAMGHQELIDDAAQFRGDMDERERYALMERVARAEPMRFIEIPLDSKLRRPTYNYRMIYPHPLPVDSVVESRLENDVAMREINHLRADQRAWRAVTKNRPWCLEELYLTGFEINRANADGLTPFHLACHFGYRECALVFLGAGVDVNLENAAGVTPLQSALAAGHADIAALLVDAGAVKRNVKKLSGHRTILDVAADRVDASRAPPCGHLAQPWPLRPSPATVAHDVARAARRPPYFLEY